MNKDIIFDHILIVVSNLENSIEFYKSIGFNHKRTIQREKDRVAVMEMGDIKIEMMNLPKGMETYREPRIDSDIGFRHIGIKVNNLKEVYNKLKEKIDFDSPPRPIKNRPGRFTVFFKDPDGIELHFVQEEQ
jgi:catechol 2,3-dioxygenase-like lactoylglutathione lyase family enzyme